MWDHRKAKAPGESPGPCICALSHGSVARARAPAPAELVVHAGAEDVVIELDVARCDICNTEGRTRERGVVLELDIEIFAFDRPAVTERVFDAGEKFGRVDLGPGTAAGHVQKRPVPKPAQAT